jgi:hypothetical protein
MGALEKALSRFMEGGQGSERIQKLMEKRGSAFDPATSIITNKGGKMIPIADFAQRIADRNAIDPATGSYVITPQNPYNMVQYVASTGKAPTLSVGVKGVEPTASGFVPVTAENAHDRGIQTQLARSYNELEKSLGEIGTSSPGYAGVSGAMAEISKYWQPKFNKKSNQSPNFGNIIV